MQWKFPVDNSDGEKFTCQRVREQRAKCNAKRVINRCKKAALKKELIKNTPFATDADKPFIPFIDPIFNKQEPSTTENNEVEFFPMDSHPFRTGTIIEGNGLLIKEREMDGLIFYDSLQVLDDLIPTRPLILLAIVTNTGQHARKHLPLSLLSLILWTRDVHLALLVSLTRYQIRITWMIYYCFVLQKMSTGMIGYSMNQLVV
jgi:hypothetical protein